MGVRYSEAMFLLDSLSSGLSLGRLLTVGRQNLLCTRAELADAFAQNRRAIADDALDRIYTAFVNLPNNNYSGRLFCEPLFTQLGATEIVSVDYSPFEGASMIHDLNEPIPVSLVDGFDTVIDFGSLEHIFNVPIALRNVLRAVKPGGRYLAALACNNFPGHGFYQFSPEFFYSVLEPRNGYEIECVLLAEDIRQPRFRRVPDPRQEIGRVTFTNSKETTIFVRARRVGDVPTTLVAYQSDYVDIWNAAQRARPTPVPAAHWNPLRRTGAQWYRAVVPEPVRRLRHVILSRLKRRRSLRGFPDYP